MLSILTSSSTAFALPNPVQAIAEISVVGFDWHQAREAIRNSPLRKLKDRMTCRALSIVMQEDPDSEEAALKLAEDGIHAEVLNVHTIKPLDEEALIDSAQKTGCVIVAEEHQRLGGLGSSVAQCLGTKLPTAMDFVAVEDQFGESGTPAQLMDKYGLNSEAIVKKAKTLLNA